MKILFLTISLLIGWQSYAGSVRGKVIDASTNEPLEYASVALYQAPGEKLISGEVTDKAGS